MGRFVQLGALACLYLGAESKALRWQDDTPSWSPPKQTIAVMNMEELGFSPKPTAAPEPANVELKLAKRVRGDDTCGYISGESTNSIYCGTGSCVINSFFSIVGCCSSSAVSDCTEIPTSCLPSRSASRFSSSDTRMQLCTAATRPECITYIYSGSLFNHYTLYACAATEEVVVVYANPTDSSVTPASTTEPATSPIINSVSTTSTPGASETPTSPTSTAPSSGGGGSSTPVGAIVGGVVGGVAAIALIVFGIIFLLRKKKKNTNDVNNNQAAHQSYAGPPPPQQGQPQMYQQPAPPMQQPSPGGYPPQQGNYPQGFTPVDNRQSMLKQPYDVTTGSYEQNHNGVSPPASPPPNSPSPTYQSGVPQYVPPQNGVSPTQGAYPPPHQQQQQQQGGYYNAPPPAQGQPPAPQQQHHHQQPGFASELPAHRGDNELRELA